jgi:hypothetical protein
MPKPDVWQTLVVPQANGSDLMLAVDPVHNVLKISLRMPGPDQTVERPLMVLGIVPIAALIDLFQATIAGQRE